MGAHQVSCFHPNLLVSLDGRRETVYSESFLKTHYELYDRPDENIALLEQLNPDYAWLPSYMLTVRNAGSPRLGQDLLGAQTRDLLASAGGIRRCSCADKPSVFPGAIAGES